MAQNTEMHQEGIDAKKNSDKLNARGFNKRNLNRNLNRKLLNFKGHDMYAEKKRLLEISSEISLIDDILLEGFKEAANHIGEWEAELLKKYENTSEEELRASREKLIIQLNLPA